MNPPLFALLGLVSVAAVGKSGPDEAEEVSGIEVAVDLPKVTIAAELSVFLPRVEVGGSIFHFREDDKGIYREVATMKAERPARQRINPAKNVRTESQQSPSRRSRPRGYKRRFYKDVQAVLVRELLDRIPQVYRRLRGTA